MAKTSSLVSEEPTGPIAAAEHIAMAASHLRAIADRNGHAFLAYLIDMAVLEASAIAHRAGDLDAAPVHSAAAALSEGKRAGRDGARRAPPDRAPEE